MYKTISSNKKTEAPNPKLNLINDISARKKSLYRKAKGFSEIILQFFYKLVQLRRNDVRNRFHMLFFERTLAEDHFQVFLKDHFFLQ